MEEVPFFWSELKMLIYVISNLLFSLVFSNFLSYLLSILFWFIINVFLWLGVNSSAFEIVKVKSSKLAKEPHKDICPLTLDFEVCDSLI